MHRLLLELLCTRGSAVCHVPIAIADLQLRDPSLNAGEGERPSESERELSQWKKGCGIAAIQKYLSFGCEQDGRRWRCKKTKDAGLGKKKKKTVKSTSLKNKSFHSGCVVKKIFAHCSATAFLAIQCYEKSNYSGPCTINNQAVNAKTCQSGTLRGEQSKHACFKTITMWMSDETINAGCKIQTQRKAIQSSIFFHIAYCWGKKTEAVGL